MFLEEHSQKDSLIDLKEAFFPTPVYIHNCPPPSLLSRHHQFFSTCKIRQKFRFLGVVTEFPDRVTENVSLLTICHVK